jgi:hypothetical protein
MENKPANPLSKHFRQPAIYIKLPSGGQYWAEGSLELPVTGEIPVYPMTARDEITIRTPDALLNGQGVIDTIKSCCPSIIDPWKMPSVDIDYVLINIRIASYGNGMDVDTTCPHCKEENSFTIDLSKITPQIGMPDYLTPMDINGLKIVLRPLPYFEINKTNQINFTEQQILRTIEDQSITDEERKNITDTYLKKLVDLNVTNAANSTQSITTEDGTVVTNSDYIKEFYDNAEFSILKTVQEKLGEIAKSMEIKPINVTCEHCNEPYSVPLSFDYSNFFA